MKKIVKFGLLLSALAWIVYNFMCDMDLLWGSDVLSLPIVTLATIGVITPAEGGSLGLFKDIISNLPISVFIKDSSGRYVFINHQFEKDFNVLNSQVVGKTDNEVMSKEISDSLLVNDKRVMDSGKQMTFEEVIPSVEGKTPYVVQKMPLKDEAGNLFICGAYRDNSNYKRMQDIVRSSENRFNFVLAATQDSIYDWDLETDRIWRNEQYERIFDGPFGPHPDWWKEHIHADDFERITVALQTVFDKNEPSWNQEYRFKRFNGEYAHVIDKGFVVYNDRKPTRMIGAITDITERKQFIYDLEHSLALSKATFESTTDGILVIDLEGKVVDFNEKFITMWELPPSFKESKDTKSIVDFMLAQLHEPDKFLNKLKYLNSDSDVESYNLLELKNGKTLERFSSPERIKDKIIGRVLSFRDISQRVKTERIEKIRTLKVIERQTELLKLNNLLSGLPFQERLKKIIETDAKAIEVERVSIQFMDNKGDVISSENIYVLSKSEYIKGVSMERLNYPRYFQELESKQIIDANDAEEDPRTSELTNDYLKKNGITSIMTVPILHNGEMVGIISNEHVGPKRKWTYEEEVFATSIADFVSLAIESEKREKTEGELKKLKQANIFIISILQNLPHIIFVKDAKDLRYVRVNKAVEEFLGFKEEELIGKNDYDLFSKEQADFFSSKDREVINKGETLDILEEPVDTKKGKRWLHTKKVVIKDEAGKPLYLLGISDDITEKKLLADKSKDKGNPKT